jgi:hypothetical protein
MYVYVGMYYNVTTLLSPTRIAAPCHVYIERQLVQCWVQAHMPEYTVVSVMGPFEYVPGHVSAVRINRLDFFVGPQPQLFACRWRYSQ